MEIRKPIPELAFSHGIADLGFLYERLLVSHLSIKCTLRSDVKDFRLVLKGKKQGPLDDVIVHLFDENGLSEVLVCQLKHKENKGEIRDFLNLNKHEKSFEDLRKKYGPNIKITVVLFTNASINHPKNVYAKPVTFEKKEILSIFSTNGEKGQCYKLENYNDNLEFYQNCYLFCHQIRAINGNQLLVKDLNECFTMEQIQCIENYFQKTIPKRKNPITKQEINFILRDMLINPFVWALDLAHDNVNLPNSELLLNTMNTFNCSKISKGNCKYLLQIIVDFIEKKLNINLKLFQWNEELPKHIVDKLIQIKEIANYAKLKIAYKPLTKKDLWFLFWAAGELPLIVKTDKSNCKQIEFLLKHLTSNVAPNVSVILYDEFNCISNNNCDLNVFNTLSDLKPLNENLLRVILERTEVSLYFNKISLVEIVNENEDLLKTINPNALIELLCKYMNISTLNEKLPFYIDRQLQFRLYNKDVAKCTEFISIVDDDPFLPHLENYCGDVGRKIYSEYTTGVTAQMVIKKITDQSFCCFQTFGDKYYCYLRNLKNPDVIEKYLTDEIINEEHLLRSQSGSKIIHGPAGIGKTTFLKNLAAKSTLDNLYIYININDLKKINESSFKTLESLAHYLLNIIVNCQKYNSKLFIEAFILTCLKKNRLHILFDGFDERNENTKILDRLFNKLRVPFIICTRSNIFIEINTISIPLVFQLLEFSQENQEEFIRKHCKYPVESQEIIDKVVKKLSEMPTVNFFGIPFVVKLFTEIYAEVKNDCQQWNLINILEKFIEKQMKSYTTNHFRRTVRNLACSLFFENDILKQLNINTRHLDEDFEDFRRWNQNDAIISNVNKRKEIRFTHRVYAEFLCAQYLHDLLTHTCPKKLKKYLKIIELLFAEHLIQLRFFFDLLVSRDMPLFTAVLLNNYNKVTEILNYDQNCYLYCDKLRRTVRHIIMGYGVRYNYPYKVGGLKNIRKQTSYNIYKKHKQFAISTKIFEVLNINNSMLNIEDAFGNDPYVYGLYSRSYQFLDICYPDSNLLSLPDINQTILFMYFISTHNLHKLFNNCLKLELFVNMNWKMDVIEKKSVTQFFSKYDTINDQFIIEMINKLIVNDNYTILHLASRENFVDIVSKILNMKLIPVNYVDSDEKTAMDYAILNNNQEVINIIAKENDTARISSTDCSNTHIELDKCPMCLTPTSSLFVNSEETGSSTIYKVIKDSDSNGLKTLIQRRAHLNIKYGINTVLVTTARYRSTEVLDILIKKIGKFSINMNKLLQHSLEKNNINNAKYLLSYNMNLGVTYCGQKSVMHLAAHGGDSNIIKLLLKRGCDIDVLDEASKTPLFYAIENKNIDTLTCLIKQRTNLRHKICDSVGVMHVAARVGNSEILSILKNAGGNINDLDARNQTPIFHSIFNNNIDTLKFLISCGVNVNHRMDKNLTIMHTAAEFGNSEVLNILIDVGCDLEALDDNKRTPIFYAVKGENMKTLRCLISKGANLNHKSASGSLLQFAEDLKKINIIKCLKNHGTRKDEETP